MQVGAVVRALREIGKKNAQPFRLQRSLRIAQSAPKSPVQILAMQKPRSRRGFAWRCRWEPSFALFARIRPKSRQPDYRHLNNRKSDFQMAVSVGTVVRALRTNSSQIPRTDSRHAKTPLKAGFRMAVPVGFEPTEGVNPHTLSRRAPLAARTRHRRLDYLQKH